MTRWLTLEMSLGQVSATPTLPPDRGPQPVQGPSGLGGRFPVEPRYSCRSACRAPAAYGDLPALPGEDGDDCGSPPSSKNSPRVTGTSCLAVSVPTDHCIDRWLTVVRGPAESVFAGCAATA